MSAECNHDCASCSLHCDQREQEQRDLRAKPHELSRVKKVIAVISGKGGVGKSLVTSLMAVKISREGFTAAILDADLTGPSIPQAFGVRRKAEMSDLGLYPVKSAGGIPIMSINLLLDQATDPVVWRGPLVAATVKQFWTNVIWGDVDFLFVDMPPGTGDVPLTVFQSLPVDGVIVVTSPQELVEMIVEKAVRMAEMMRIPVLAVVENMSYFRCPDCGGVHRIFGESRIQETAAKYGIKTLCRLPIDPELARAVDAGRIEQAEAPDLDPLVALLIK